jgi:hypothetical protein
MYSLPTLRILARFLVFVSLQCYLLALPFVGKDIVFRFNIEYSRLMDFGPLVIGLFLYEDFLKDGILACVET